MSQPENPVFTAEYEQLRQVLTRARRSAGLSQRELARRLGRSTPHVTLLEKGQRRVDILEFYRLFRALDLDPADVAREVFHEFDRVSCQP